VKVAQKVDSTAPIRGLVGNVNVPGNASISVAALCLAAAANGTSEIRNCARHPDVDRARTALQELGVQVERNGRDAKVLGGGISDPDRPIGGVGDPLLFGCLAGLLAGASRRARVETTGLSEEDLGPTMESLGALGVRPSRSAPGVYDLSDAGPVAGTCRLEAANRAAKCTLLLAGLGVKGVARILQPSAGDEDLERLLKAAGVAVDRSRDDQANHSLAVTGPVVPAQAVHELPGDADAALFLMLTAAMLPASDLTLSLVGNDWKTRRAIDLLRRLNVSMEIQMARTSSGFPARQVRVTSSELRRTKLSGEQANLFVGELPFLAVVGACASGETIIRDAQPLRNGSPDGLSLVAENLRRMQVRVGEIPDGLVVQGGRRLQGANLDAGGDPRIGMAFTLAGLVAEGPTEVTNAGDLDLVYPDVLACVESVSQQRRAEQ